MGLLNTPFTFYDYSLGVDGGAQWKCNPGGGSPAQAVTVFNAGSYAWLWYRRIMGHLEFAIRVVLSELSVTFPNTGGWTFDIPEICTNLPYPSSTGLVFAGGGPGFTAPPFIVPALAYDGIAGKYTTGVGQVNLDANGATTVVPIVGSAQSAVAQHVPFDWGIACSLLIGNVVPSIDS